MNSSPSQPADNPLAVPKPVGTDTGTPPEPTGQPSADASSVPASPLQLLRGGPFTRYAAGEAISMTGTWMQGMAQGWVMTGLTTQAVWLGMVNFASSIPMLVLMIFGGSLADRLDKRKILIGAQIIQLILALIIGYLVMTGKLHIWHVLVASTILGIASAFEMPAASALVPELVKKEEISGAIAIDRSIFHGTRSIGPALAGFVAGKFGSAAAFYINALTFFPLMFALATIKERAAGSAEEEKERASGMWAGFQYVRRDSPTLAMLGLMASASLCVFPFMAVMMPLYARNELHVDVNRAGLLMTFTGVGSFLSSLAMLRVPRGKRVPCMIGGVALVAMALLALSRVNVFWMAAVAVMVLAVGTSLIYGLANTTVQERAPSALRGRVSAVAGLSFIGMMPFVAGRDGSLGPHRDAPDDATLRRGLRCGGICHLQRSGALLRGRPHSPNARRPGAGSLDSLPHRMTDASNETDPPQSTAQPSDKPQGAAIGWELLASRHAFQGKVNRLRQDQVRIAGRGEIEYSYLERGDSVIIVP